MRPAAVLPFAAALALTACAVPAARIGLPVAGPKAAWDMQASATSGAALVQRAADGREALRIACRRNPQDLYVAAAGRPAQAGPLALEVGDGRFPLTGEAEAPTLVAVGAWPDGLPAALMSGGAIRLDLGGRRWSFTPPDAKTAAAFAIACRGPVR